MNQRLAKDKRRVERTLKEAPTEAIEVGHCPFCGGPASEIAMMPIQLGSITTAALKCLNEGCELKRRPYAIILLPKDFAADAAVRTVDVRDKA